MISRTLETLLKTASNQIAVQAVQSRMGLTDAVIRYAFWHLDQKHDGKLPGVMRQLFPQAQTGRGKAMGQIEVDLVWNDSEQYVEMVVELVQMDLLVGQANKMQATERALARRPRQPVAAAAVKLLEHVARPVVERTHVRRATQRQEVAARWKVVASRRARLAEDSATWDDKRVIAMQESIRSALTAWQTAVTATDLP